ncbi:MAG: geranylgeranyl reductase family protein [Candidatus Altiarchaeales archaeon]|nr:geranylgeranyl reductase family protein [Candidatus Altiarchaeales archaeon]MBD3416671.1 geranylgeranyl reductase family protein [Candidatus Altiarchaeales archaeon]
MRYDVAVVGNGPAGCIAAERGCSANEVALVGTGIRRMQCAGLISKSGLERIDASPGDTVLNKVRGARMYSPGKVEVEIDGRRTKAYALDRPGFDMRLQDKALKAGATYVEDWVSSLNGGVNLRFGGELKADRIVLATGTDYTLHRQRGVEMPRDFLIGGQYEMKVDCDPDFVELHFTVPDFFAWVIPAGDVARVGLCVKSNPRPYLDDFVKRLKSAGRVRSDSRHSESFGIIPIHEPSLRTQYDNIVTVGDAAGQVKASTGGGVVFGGISAAYSCRPDYEACWRRELGGELRLHLMIHRMLCRMSDDTKDRMFRAAREGTASLESGGDMDLASKTLSALMKNPRFLFKALFNMPHLLADMI